MKTYTVWYTVTGSDRLVAMRQRARSIPELIASSSWMGIDIKRIELV